MCIVILSRFLLVLLIINFLSSYLIVFLTPFQLKHDEEAFFSCIDMWAILGYCHIVIKPITRLRIRLTLLADLFTY